MRILQVSPYFHPHVGGVETHVRDVSLELIKRGHDVTVLTSRYDSDLASQETYEGLKIIRVRPLLTAFSTPVTPRICGEIDRSYDLVHAHSPPPFSEFFAVRTASHLGIPSVLTYHCDLEIPLIIGPLITEIYRRTLGRYAISTADRIIVTTRSYAATSRAVWKYYPKVIPNTVDVSRFRPGLDPSSIRERHNLGDRPVILYVGRIVFHKGLEYFIDSAMFTKKEAVHLIVGGGPYMRQLKLRARRRRVSDRVVFAGPVLDVDLPKYYAVADVFVLPSVSRLEAFGIVALEAMASGIPVVVSNIPGVREVVTHGLEGLLADPMDPGDIARKVNLILEDHDLAEAMGRRGRRKVVNEFSLERVTDTIESLYENVLEEHRHS